MYESPHRFANRVVRSTSDSFFGARLRLSELARDQEGQSQIRHQSCLIGHGHTDWAATSVRELQWHSSQKIVRDNKDFVIAEFDLSHTTEFKRWLLGFGPHAVVLKPKDLAAEVKADLAAARAAYGKVQ